MSSLLGGCGSCEGEVEEGKIGAYPVFLSLFFSDLAKDSIIPHDWCERSCVLLWMSLPSIPSNDDRLIPED